MFNINTILRIATLFTSTVMSSYGYALEPLDESSLRSVSGQSAFYTQYIAPGGNNPNPNIGIFTLGLQASMELNANIHHLQLGCGGVNGPRCDIDISDVRLAGLIPDANGNYAGSDAVLTNPFMQLAILNPTSLSTRQLAGINFGAQNAVGTMSIGENPNPSVPTPPGGESGIKTISGAFQASLANVVLPVAVCTYAAPNCAGFLNVQLLSGAASIASTSSQPNGVYTQFVAGTRISTVNLGPVSMSANLILPGIPITATLQNQMLITLHNLVMNNTTNTSNPLSLSLNSQTLTWPTQSGWSQAPAQTGWWLTLPPVSIAGTPTNPLTTSTVYTDLAGAAAGLLSNLNVPSINAGQIPIQNCYGGLKFC